MTQTLATTVVHNETSALATGGSTPAVVMDLAAILPEAKRTPRIFIGANADGMPFYAWDASTESRAYQQCRSFTALITGIKTVVQNPEDELKRSVKLIVDLALESGQEISLSCGAKTYSALTLAAGLNGLTAEQLARPVGLSGKAGQKGVVFMSVYSDGQQVRDLVAEDLIKEARADDTQVAAIEGYVSEIQARLAA